MKVTNERKMRKLKEKGITLIALVVTIIILLILAGVTINLALGENGLISATKKAAKNYTEAQDSELAGLNEITNMLGGGYNENKIALDGSYSVKKKVNMPKIAGTGLEGVTIDNTGKVTTISNTQIESEDWYNYETGANNQWANAKTRDGSLWVWIPRFAYKLDKNAKTIDVVFLQGTSDKVAGDSASGVPSSEITVKKASDTSVSDGENVFIVHPAFTDESSTQFANGGWDKEIPGFWMAKFEAGFVGEPENANEEAKDSPVKYSVIKGWYRVGGKTQETNIEKNYYGTMSTDTKIKWPTFQGCRPSFNYIGISDAYELCSKIGDKSAENNPYQLSNVDSHLMKNSEWGAVAYLSYSDYGRGKDTEVTINNKMVEDNETIWGVTGYGGSSISAESETDTLENIVSGKSQGVWYSNQGCKASTTGNVYGIYDMSGGNWDWTSGCIATSGSDGSYELYSGKLKGNLSDKYKSVYAYNGNGKEMTNNFGENDNLKRIGEAIWETSTAGNGEYNWNQDSSIFVYDTRPFTERGRSCESKTLAGVFALANDVGFCSFAVGFRPILVCN